MGSNIWRIIGSAAGELTAGIIEAIMKGDDWEPLVDTFGDKLKLEVGQELHRQQTIDELAELRRRVLGEDD